ncbi:TSUP family transporter [Halomarina halobia]|uniref:Probable membrane transporter protein n=1 Tax=Halomarina halobia TaxID=3033386 RepID=A0ABD6AGM9_9EURY|nr:sulfite exporter TauE/SafE family protein [Halomarina sp. PSR21]
MLFGFAVWDLLCIVLVSFSVCVLATALAIESAALFVPIILVVFPRLVPSFPTLTTNGAVGLTLVIMVFGQTSAVSGYWYRGQIDWQTARAILVLTIPFAVFARLISFLVPSSWLLALFAVFVLVLAVVVAVAHSTRWGSTRRAASAGSSAVAIRISAFDAIAFRVSGLFAGLVGFSVGEVSNTILNAKNGVPMQFSVGTSTLVLYLTLLAATLTNLGVVQFGVFSGQEVVVPWYVAGIIAPVVLVGGQVGAFFNSRLSEPTIAKAMIATYVLVGLVSLSRAWTLF